jgi:hypothetical protein
MKNSYMQNLNEETISKLQTLIEALKDDNGAPLQELHQY